MAKKKHKSGWLIHLHDTDELIIFMIWALFVIAFLITVIKK